MTVSVQEDQFYGLILELGKSHQFSKILVLVCTEKGAKNLRFKPEAKLVMEDI